ncbi:MAG: outer membrane protein beta-barrel domain [Bacteroidota bacterium]|jgi:hypothetical protein
MKKLLLILLLLQVTYFAFAQSDSVIRRKNRWCYSISAGSNYSSLDSKKRYPNSKGNFGWHIQQAIYYSFHKNFAVGIGLSYSNFAFTEFTTLFIGTFSRKQTFSSIEIPIQFKYTLNRIKYIKPYITVGYSRNFIMKTNLKRYTNNVKEADFEIPFNPFCSFLFTSLGFKKTISNRFDLFIDFQLSQSYKPLSYTFNTPSPYPETITNWYPLQMFRGALGVNYKF